MTSTTTEAPSFSKLCSDVARELSAIRGETWTIDPDLEQRVARGLVLLGPGHAAIVLSDSWRHEGKVAAEALYPTGYGRGIFEANVAMHRGAHTIAKELSRRIIEAGYLTCLAAAVQAKTQREQADAEQVEVLRRAAAVVGGGKPDKPDAEIGFGRYDYREAVMHGSVKSYWNGRGLLTIEAVGVPADVAMRVLEVLAECARAQACEGGTS